MLYSDTPNFTGQRPWKGLYLMFHKEPIRQLQVKAPKQFPPQLLNKIVRRDKTRQEARLYNRGIKIFLTDEDFKKFFGDKEHYLIAFKIKSVDQIESSKSRHKPLEKKLKDGHKVSMNNKYMNTFVDTNFDAFVEAIAKKNHIKNECWLNSIVDVYADTLMSNKRKERVDRNKILQIIDKTEETIKNGISVQDIKPFFEKYRLQLRVYDEYIRPIYKYDPDVVNRHNKVMYCMVKGDHVYTLNHNLHSLHHKSDEESMILKASENYYIKDDAVIPTFKMIDGVNDIIRIIKEVEDPEDNIEIKLVHKNNNLTDFLFDLKEAGYEPSVKYGAGHIVRLEFVISKFNQKEDAKYFDEVGHIQKDFSSSKTIRLCIESQQLLKDSLDGDICVDTIDVYNKMNEAMATFNKSLIKPEFKSYYSKTDIDVLDEYRTVVPIGRLSSFKGVEDLVEIDISKAFTSAFLKISEVPVFNEFDYFKPYDNHEIRDYCLYIVKTSKPNLFLNKTYNIVYGLFLNGFVADVEILAFKQPSFIKKINSKTIIDNLWNNEISTDIEEDKGIKKLIANVNFGLLEKSNNKVQKSKIYETHDEAKYYQEQFGGRINILYKYIETFEIDDHDVGTDNPPLNRVLKESDKKYYVLNVSDKACLKNGFRYMKELLLQFHNFKMFTDHNILKNNNINVITVKSDAFTINKHDLDKAKSLINFS